MYIPPEWIIGIVMIVIGGSYIFIVNSQDDDDFRRKQDEIRKTKSEVKPSKAEEVFASIVATLILGTVILAPIFMAGSLLSDSDEIGFGPAILLIIIFVFVGRAGWKSGGASNAAPPPPPKPPAYVDKNWQHSPGGIETQKFEGGYNGELNKEFEQK